MGGYINKCMGEGEIAVVELADLGDDGVRTTSVIPAMASELKEEESCSGTAEKRSREVGDAEFDLTNASLVEERSIRRRVVIEAPANCSFLEETNCASVPATCSSNEASVELVGGRSTIGDLTGQTKSAQLETLTFSGGIERSRKIPLADFCAAEFGDLESMAPARPSPEANPRHKSNIIEMPSELEIEETFSAAEKDLQKRFSERYNFDFVKGVPLEGRYEWVREKP